MCLIGVSRKVASELTRRGPMEGRVEAGICNTKVETSYAHDTPPEILVCSRSVHLGMPQCFTFT